MFFPSTSSDPRSSPTLTHLQKKLVPSSSASPTTESQPRSQSSGMKSATLMSETHPNTSAIGPHGYATEAAAASQSMPLPRALAASTRVCAFRVGGGSRGRGFAASAAF